MWEGGPALARRVQKCSGLDHHRRCSGGAEAGGQGRWPLASGPPAPGFPAWPQTSLRSIRWITMRGQQPSVLSVYPAKHLSGDVM